MGKRLQQKEMTKNTILKAAMEEVLTNGYLQASTLSIARAANVAHGTVFLHFETKEELILEIFMDKIHDITDELHSVLKRTSDLESLLDRYLRFLEKEEAFFTVLVKDFPHYSDALKRNLIAMEAAVRKYFVQAFENGISLGTYKQIEATIALSFLFGTIEYFLNKKELFVTKGSVIKAKKGMIKSTFISFITKGESND